MAITQEVNIEMLEKLPDGNYKKKNPQTKASQVIANNGTTVEQHLADDSAIKHKAKTIALEDTANKFTATNVESGMLELFTNVSNGKQAVGTAITGVDNSIVIPTNPSFGDLASVIAGISTGKKWASGSESRNSSNPLHIQSLDFTPSIVILRFDSDVYKTIIILNKQLENMNTGSVNGDITGIQVTSVLSNANYPTIGLFTPYYKVGAALGGGTINVDGFICVISHRGSNVTSSGVMVDWIAYE